MKSRTAGKGQGEMCFLRASFVVDGVNNSDFEAKIPGRGRAPSSSRPPPTVPH